MIPSASHARPTQGPKFTLQDMKNKLISKDLFFWDRAPEPYRGLNVRALKLFGLATPQTDFSTQEIPADFDKFRHVRPINTASSAIFRTLGNKEYPTLVSCAIAVAKNEATERPPIVKDLLRMYAPSWQNTLPDEEFRILLDRNTVVFPESACSQPGFKELEVKSKIRLDMQFSAAQLAYIPSQLPANVKPLYSFKENEDVKRIIEVLNVFPMASSGEKQEHRLLQVVVERCQQAGFAPSKVEVSTKAPFELPRVFIELLDDDQCSALAEKLGQMKVDGRSLITLLSYRYR